MKKFRIVELERNVLKYRVDQRHWLFGIIPYWDFGASDLCPKYLFDTKEEALEAIAKLVTVGY